MTCRFRARPRWPSRVDDRNASTILRPCGHAARIQRDFAAGVLLDPYNPRRYPEVIVGVGLEQFRESPTTQEK